MATTKIIINDVHLMTEREIRKAMDAAIGYNDWLNETRDHKDPPTVYQNFKIHESAKGTIIVNLKNA